VDFDGFKGVNDRHGHQAGDRLLEAVARALEDVVRGSEVVARVGGDEFALMLPETAVAGAEATAERVRSTVGRLSEAINYGVTASAGVAELAQAGTVEALVRAADAALYRSKTEGRDRVTVHDPESRSPLE
jgi:diguanylate cyclase (GGDEF)-like protein